jgi:hypothetical protein
LLEHDQFVGYPLLHVLIARQCTEGPGRVVVSKRLHQQVDPHPSRPARRREARADALDHEGEGVCPRSRSV